GNNGNGNNANGNATASDCIQLSKVITKKGKWYQSTNPNDDAVSGVHTYWKNQPLKVRIKLKPACRQYRWAKLSVIARNINGPLPDFYHNFNVEVRRGNKGKVLGAMTIPAADQQYHSGSIYVRIRPANTFWLLWTNDAWKEGVYDANINIKSVKLELVGSPVQTTKKVKRNGDQHCYTNGNFFFDKKTARTYWANQTIGYCFDNLESGIYEVRVSAKNYGAAGLPADYQAFAVNVAADGVSENISIQASDTAYKSSLALLDVRGGDTVVNLVWTNDKYKQGVYDANIMYRQISLRRVANSERASLAAYIGQHSNNIVMLFSLFVAVGALAAIMLYRRRQEGFEGPDF
ncbi:MAG: hypothetical protein KDK39_04795, partial [Leptospiraceae bacterium]|nr:hypothetical protein [Leptospiraceae bacterium]